MNIFDYAPEGATELKVNCFGNVYWVNANGECYEGRWGGSTSSLGWKTIATRPQEAILTGSGGSATQDNDLDVDWTTYKCEDCGNVESDI